MLTAIGILLLLVALGIWLVKLVVPKQTPTGDYIRDDKKAIVYDNYGNAKRAFEPSKHWAHQIPKTTFLSIAGVGLLLTVVTSIFFYAKPGTAYAVQYLWGGDKAIFTQGIKVKLFGRTIPIQYEIPVQDVLAKYDNDGEFIPIEEDDDIYHRVAEQWEFADAIKAQIGTSVIIGMDITNEEAFLNMADRNKTEGKLVNARIMPNIDAALRLTCKLMDAQDYISGEAAMFDRYFRDQLQNGTYILEEYFEEERTPEIIGDSTTIRTVTNGTSKTKKYRIKYKNGAPMRDNSNSLKQYGLNVLQAKVTDIDWEASFDKRLDLQKNEVAQTQLEKQQAEREYYRAKKEIAKGESEKAAERAKLEKEQIQKTIEAETKAKVAEFNLLEEKKLYEVAQYSAKTKKTLADAEAYQNQRLVNAGLTPQERAEWEYKTAIGVAKELKELKLPSTYFANGQGGNSQGGLLESLIGAELAKGMINKN